MKDNRISAILFSYQQKELVPQCLEALEQTNLIENVIVIDEDFTDETGKLPAYGRILNMLLDNYSTEEYLLVLTPRYLPGNKTLREMMSALDEQETSGFAFTQPPIPCTLPALYRLEETAESCPADRCLGLLQEF